MNALRQAIRRFVRGGVVTAFLERLGIDPRRYWLLMDLFGQLSERRELFSQLGRDGVSLQKASWAYYILSGLMAVLLVLARPSPASYFSGFLAFTGFLLLAILLSETSNSLVNPVEALVLVHQPINGATYTAAKLTHLLRILLHLVPGLTLLPALVGYFLKGCAWFYPPLFLLTAFALGLLLALSCCALFGWLILLVPASRLKAVGMLAEALPWLFCLFFQFSRNMLRHIDLTRWLPAASGTRAMLAAGLGVVALAMGATGIRALSADYLVRVATIAHGGSRSNSKMRRSRLSDLVARLAGGPAARAGFEYLSRMMARDWQFRRQVLQVAPLLLMSAIAAFQTIRVSPFSAKFTAIHLVPHAFGLAFYTICNVIVFGTDHQGVWLFLLAPPRALRGLACGIYARLFTLIVIPHLLLLPVLAWFWGIRDATLFAAYSLAAVAVYLSLELRLIDGLPFSRQPEATQNFLSLPVMCVGGAVMAAAVGFQYFVIFRSPAVVAAVTLALGAAAWFLTRASLHSFEISIRFRLESLSAAGKGLYTEIEM